MKKEHTLLNATDFVKYEDSEYTIFIYYIKNNQCGFIENCGKADKLILPNYLDITLFIDKYLSLCLYCIKSNFYLQEIEEQFGNILYY
ncbi:hypothetical protein GLOIN_2v1482564 [Rhizophagus clarus]|uniref:Uncharacterized protein n=1 Tax=Rhizophagus clarus TaxID=94130 RepID=A0A8H3M1X2_9GLOM|nr:hypothetical protein GLOIN_2v1482564 [Rhizophagus clarus]